MSSERWTLQLDNEILADGLNRDVVLQIFLAFLA